MKESKVESDPAPGSNGSEEVASGMRSLVVTCQGMGLADTGKQWRTAGSKERTYSTGVYPIKSSGS